MLDHISDLENLEKCPFCCHTNNISRQYLYSDTETEGFTRRMNSV